MAKLTDEFVYLMARSGVFIANRLSDKAAYSFGGLLGRIACRLSSRRRDIAFDNLKQAMGGRFTDEELSGIVVKVFENIGRTFIEFCRFEKIGRETTRRIIHPAGLDILDEVKKKGNGAVLITAHFGNWEMLGAFLTNHGYEVEAMVGIQHNKKINGMVTSFRKAFDIGIILIGGSNYRKIFKTLRSNRFVIIVPDQHDPSASLIMDFFGRKTTVARGPALFAIKNNCPIIPILNRRIAYDNYQIMMGQAIYPPGTGDEEEDIKIMSRQYMDYLEDVIKTYPEQWMWTHRRWKI